MLLLFNLTPINKRFFTSLTNLRARHCTAWGRSNRIMWDRPLSWRDQHSSNSEQTRMQTSGPKGWCTDAQCMGRDMRLHSLRLFYVLWSLSYLDYFYHLILCFLCICFSFAYFLFLFLCLLCIAWDLFAPFCFPILMVWKLYTLFLFF